VLRRSSPAAFAALLLAAGALLALSISAGADRGPRGTGLAVVPTVHASTDAPPPAPSMARRQSSRVQRGVRLIATPSTLPAAGGLVRLHARVPSAVRCRFSSASTLRQLPSTRRCGSGRATVLVSVPRNRTAAPRRYVLSLTVNGADGTRRTVRDVVVVRRRARSGSGPGVTRSSGVNTQSAESNSGQSTGNLLGGLSNGQAGSPNLPAAPVVTSQPANESVAPNAAVLFTAAASGNPAPAVQWQVSTNGGATWVNTRSAFNASASENGYEYRSVFTNQAGSATSNVVTLTVLPTSTTNFAGYIAYAAPGQSFSAVSANWTVPTVTCQTGETSWAAQWPGIGDDTTVQQDGTETDCFNGAPTYWAWYEMYGDPQDVNGGYAVPLPGSAYPVAPGDQMSGSVSFDGSNWLLVLADATKNWKFQISIPSPSQPLSQGSAEWMVEDPNGCTPQCEVLAHSSAVQFTNATATANGLAGPLSTFPLTAMQIQQSSALLATVGPLQSGTGFTVTRLAG
jgi:Peptidase A4 family